MYTLSTPSEKAGLLAEKLKALRLSKKWKRATLAERSGVTEASLRRFEQTGKASLDNLLKLMQALGRLDEIDALLNPPQAMSIDELKKGEKSLPKRGSI